jgi:hypothetical protein
MKDHGLLLDATDSDKKDTSDQSESVSSDETSSHDSSSQEEGPPQKKFCFKSVVGPNLSDTEDD